MLVYNLGGVPFYSRLTELETSSSNALQERRDQPPVGGVDCSGEEEEIVEQVKKRQEQGRRKRDLRCSNIFKKKIGRNSTSCNVEVAGAWRLCL